MGHEFFNRLPRQGRAIGIDPGLNGAVVSVLLDVLTGEPYVDWVADLASYRAPKGTRYWRLEELDFMSQLHWPSYDCAVIEDVAVQSAASSQTSMFKMGWAKGVLHGLLVEALLENVPVLDIKPNVWKPMLGLGKKKAKSIELALSLFPNHKDVFRLTKHHDRAEAALLALIGLVLVKGQDR